MPKLKPGSELTVEDLKATHELYAKNVGEWRFLMSAYEGTKELVEKGYLFRNERESPENWERRKSEAAGFDYSSSIVDLFNFYLFKKPVTRIMGKLEKDEAWVKFNMDCNLYDEGFDDFLTEQGRYSSIYGQIGMVVDKPGRELANRKEELDEGIYPYIVAYFPTAILDWEYERDENNRPFLSYIKLLDDDGVYRLWWQGKWEMWELPVEEDKLTTNKATGGQVAQKTKAKKLNSGNYHLDKIPFVWLVNKKGRKRPIGRSDIHEVARLDVSILRNESQGEEIISYAAFPMMRKPSKEAKPDGGISIPAEDQVGVQSILEFDPDKPESKPDWLDSKVREPIEAILDWVKRKVEEIYRVVNAGGMASTEISTEAKSGVALTVEFQLLNSALVRKAKNLEKTEKEIIKHWLAWQNQSDYYKDISIERERSYDVDDLARDLENVLTASIIVKSKKFSDRMQKGIVRQMLPAAEDDEIKEIDEEIDKSVEPMTGEFEEFDEE